MTRFLPIRGICHTCRHGFRKKLTFVPKDDKVTVCEIIIKLNYMEKILLSCPLLYLNGTVTNELLKGEKVIAVVVENTLMSLKNQIRMTYSGAERECENLTFADGHCGYLSLKKEFELWVSHREEINQPVQVLRENGINADFLPAGTVYWTAGGDKFYAPAVNASSGHTLKQDKGSYYVSRAAIGK